MPDAQKTIDGIMNLFDRMGLPRVSVPVLQPADPFLDIVGEDLRRRIFMTENETGDSLCLRPEFTIPVCLAHIADGHQTPRRYAYLGEVFRQRREGASSFYQAGIEDLGDMDEAEADARSLHDAMHMLDNIASPFAIEVLVGDHAIFEAVLHALGLPRGWQRKLMRCFGNNQQLRDVLSDLAKPGKPLYLPAHIADMISHDDGAGLSVLIEEEMLRANISPAASRSPKEIAQRLMEKSELSRLQLDTEALHALEEFLAIDVAFDEAENRLNAFAAKNNLALDGVISRFAARSSAIKRAGIKCDVIRYDAAFGRPLDYYTSFVYEIRNRSKADTVLIGGGRYNRLLTMLGALSPIPAVGFSLWLDMIAED